MPVLRLFAQAREAAGAARDVVDGDTVDQVLAAAEARYGPVFAALLPSCRIWVNGEPAHGTDKVTDSDEVAILPPVSGGAA
jgi:molybdopterin synthase sulfur carrier subunit